MPFIGAITQESFLRATVIMRLTNGGECVNPAPSVNRGRSLFHVTFSVQCYPATYSGFDDCKGFDSRPDFTTFGLLHSGESGLSGH